MRRITGALAGVVAGAAAAALAWLPLLALFALAFGGAGALSGERLGREMRSPVVLMLVGVVPLLGAIQGGVTGAVRGKLGGGAMMEAMLSPFAWVMTAGEGLAGGVVMVASLLPGASLGALMGLWLAGTRPNVQEWPPEAGVGALIGVAASLVGLNLYVQWPTLRARPPEAKAEAPAEGGTAAEAK